MMLLPTENQSLSPYIPVYQPTQHDYVYYGENGDKFETLNVTSDIPCTPHMYDSKNCSVTPPIYSRSIQTDNSIEHRDSTFRGAETAPFCPVLDRYMEPIPEIDQNLHIQIQPRESSIDKNKPTMFQNVWMTPNYLMCPS